MSKYLNMIIALDPQLKQARVQPEVICDHLRQAAEHYHLTFGPDPATHNHCTLGGMIGNNSCGAHSVMAGKTVDNIEELEVLTYDGLRLRRVLIGAPKLRYNARSVKVCETSCLMPLVESAHDVGTMPMNALSRLIM